MEHSEKSRFQYETAVCEEISCNLCGADSLYVLARKISSGMNVQTCMCKNCGLIFINPRMTRTEYDRYYKTYYHEERLRTKGKTSPKYADPAGRGFENAYQFGRALAEDFRKWICKGVILDVGSSYGGLLAGVKDTIRGVSVVGIEPSSADAAYANSQGIETYNTLFENFRNDKINSLSTVFCVQTFNHLLDPRGFLVWSHDHLAMGGTIILAVKNFRQQCRRAGAIYSSVQIDHPYMFTPETLTLMIQSVGFEIVYMDVDEHKKVSVLKRQKERGMSMHHMRFVVRKTRPEVLRRDMKKLKGDVLFFRAQFFLPYLKLYHVIVYGGWKRYMQKIGLSMLIR
ncbi:MAG: hypothetical protein G01um101448_87 [Parcubacteria group bacterium Gr01-1014_48]|nr:MAG: hypothetical protein Greene041614_8 [Parcubacteria group bacterium Greene0416_14]TSC74446.1 MAG: hypothetical protein G01um101448_87 [Parcubacteria group bacterium Gr01-1014_48]TSD01756.1 MAG: hypothetical protein Greene101415_14 [Parcubacteria group bacterium Greene1014_15]TSD08470.1 MAG: hypothetical protein Greene07144_9 [Parcubacteria group bacterium Greene0714_4]